MKSEWKRYKLSEIADFTTGKLNSNAAVNNGKYPFFTCAPEPLKIDTYKFDTEAIILAGNNAEGNFHISFFKGKFNAYQRTYVITTKDDNISDIRYLYYALGRCLTDFKNISQGTATKFLTAKILSNFEILLPPIFIQKRIVSVLCDLDDKIELNNKINNNLEQQAQAIFKSWFVDFEPYGKNMPKEWSNLTLGQVSVMGAGGDKPKTVSPIKTDICPYPIYSNGLSEEGLYGYTDNPKIYDESVTVSARGTIGFVCLRHTPYVPIVRLVTLIPNTEIISAKYLYLYLKQLHIMGTGTTQQQLTVPDFQKTEIMVPDFETMTIFTDIVSPLYNTIWANQLENQRLSELRDTLLPKLMSGELDVSEIDL